MFRSIVFGLAVVAAMAWSGASASTAEARHCHGGGYRHYPSYRTSHYHGGHGGHHGGGHYYAPRRVVYVGGGGGYHGGHHGGHYGGHHGYHHGGYRRSGLSFAIGF